jgi:hypothetical protein
VENLVTNQTTADLLEAWRKAQRASDAAHRTAELALEAAEAAAAAAEAARKVAENAGLTLDEADVATAAAKDAYSDRQRQATTGGAQSYPEAIEP